MSNDIVQRLRLAAAVILSADGDRDWSCRSNLLVEEALAAANEFKLAADHIESLERQYTAYRETAHRTIKALRDLQ
jgi:hypothetical protein